MATVTRLAIVVLLLVAAVGLMGPSCVDGAPPGQTPGVSTDFEDAYTREGRRAPPRLAGGTASRPDEID